MAFVDTSVVSWHCVTWPFSNKLPGNFLVFSQQFPIAVFVRVCITTERKRKQKVPDEACQEVFCSVANQKLGRLTGL